MSTRTIKCGHCQQQGHNRRTCPMRNVTIRRKGKKVKKVKKIKKIILRKKAAPAPTKTVVETCSICMDGCKGKTCTLECGHKFHTKCIFTWFKKNNNCPLCRAVVPELKKEAGPIQLPSIPFLGACCHMVDDALATGGLPNGLTRDNIDNHNYTKAVMTMMAISMSGREQSELEHLRTIGAFVNIEEW